MNVDGKIEQLLKEVFYDIKAEAIIADLIENGLNIDEVVVFLKGGLKRGYSRDIDVIDEVKLTNGQKLFGIHLNRDSIYDSLPEGLFHDRNASTSNTKSVSEDTKKIKQEEKAARSFFLPFENEIIRQRVLLELEERKVISCFSEKIFDDIYPEIWDLHHTLNSKYIYRLALLLHFAHKIAGRPRLIAKSLETILHEKVEIRIENNNACRAKENTFNKKQESMCALGEGELGVNLVCGEQFKDYGKTMEFHIGPLKNTHVEDYLENGPLAEFLECFYSYFVPVDYTVKSLVVVIPLKQGFKLGKENGGPVLGFGSAI